MPTKFDISTAIETNLATTKALFTTTKVIKKKSTKYKTSKTILPEKVRKATETTTQSALIKRVQEPVEENEGGKLIQISQSRKIIKPTFHPPWKLKTLISGHTGPIRSLTVDKSNTFFCSGGGDRLIKIWDLASGVLKLSLTGHIGTIRGLALSDRHPYLFSAGIFNENLIFLSGY